MYENRAEERLKKFHHTLGCYSSVLTVCRIFSRIEILNYPGVLGRQDTHIYDIIIIVVIFIAKIFIYSMSLRRLPTRDDGESRADTLERRASRLLHGDCSGNKKLVINSRVWSGNKTALGGRISRYYEGFIRGFSCGPAISRRRRVWTL